MMMKAQLRKTDDDEDEKERAKEKQELAGTGLETTLLPFCVGDWNADPGRGMGQAKAPLQKVDVSLPLGQHRRSTRSK